MDNKQLKVSLSLKEKFAKNRHSDTKELLTYRDNLLVKVIKLRDGIAEKRHKERLEILNIKL